MKLFFLLLALPTLAFAKTQGPIQWEMTESRKNKAAPQGVYQIDFSFWSSNGPATYDVALRTLPSSVLEIASKRTLTFRKTAADKKTTFAIVTKLNQETPLQNTLVVDVTQHQGESSTSQSIPVRLPLDPAAAPEKLMQKAK